jgi:2-polyprenyl-3-methyl-5-hydroxy-6-metoxy-1,4-benzoquinol methylase
MTNLNNCPCCGSAGFEPFLSCKDYTVSQETFQIVSCKTCSFKFTNPRPKAEKIGDYYKAESYISHSNTSKGLISKLYKAVRNYTLKGKLNLVSKYSQRGSLLDYGCGTGMFLSAARGSTWNGYGIEPDPGARNFAKKESGAEVYADVETADGMLRGVDFNCITLWHVLEHVLDLNQTLAWFNSKLKNNGTLIIAVPNYTSYDARHYKEFWAAYDLPRHLYHFEEATMIATVQKAGFKHIESLPMKFDSFYVSMLSEKYKTGKINYASAFLSGLRSNLKAKKAKDYSSVIYVFKKA